MMKKILHILPMLAVLGFLVLQSSCWNNGYDPDYSFVISMNATQASSSTKGVINGIDDLKKPTENFGVYGFKSYQSDKAIMVFANQQVSWNDPKWEYSPLKYWDRDQQYYYAAYAPYLGTKDSAPYVSHNETSGSAVAHIMTINNIPNWQPLEFSYGNTSHIRDNSGVDAARDLMVATDRNSAVNYLTNQEGTVFFDFQHILAQLKVNVSFPNMPDVYNTDYIITSVVIGKNSGDDYVSGQEVPASGQTSSYALTYYDDKSSEVSRVMTSTEKSTAIIYPVVDESGKNEFLVKKENDLLCSYLCVPFECDTQDAETSHIYITVNYKSIETNPDTQEKAVPVNWSETFPIGELTGFEAGKIYTLNIEFDKGKLVQVIGVAVSDWENGGTKDHPVFNW